MKKERIIKEEKIKRFLMVNKKVEYQKKEK